MKTSRAVVSTAFVAASALLLAGCGGSPAAEETTGTEAPDDRLSVVASTNVYGSIAEEIGGDFVEVTSIVTSAAQDPHEYEPSAQDQLTISRAGLIIQNGGGYDSFVEALIESSGTEAPVLTAAEYSHDWPGEDAHAHEHSDAEGEHADDAHAEEGHDHDHDHGHAEEGHDHAEEGDDHGHDHEGHNHIEGFNEHVWYDPHTMEHLAEAIAEQLGELVPDQADAFTANAEAFIDEIGGLESSLAEIEASDAGAAVFVTEPVPLYLIEAAGLRNVSPEAFTEAVEEGQDVPPATLLEAMNLLGSGEVRVVIVNAQTGGAETTQVIQEAEGRGIPVVEFSETLPEGQTYISWMDENIAALADALGQ